MVLSTLVLRVWEEVGQGAGMGHWVELGLEEDRELGWALLGVDTEEVDSQWVRLGSNPGEAEADSGM